MPELPEVQSMIDTLIDDGCLNHKIIGVETIMPKLFKNSNFKEFENHIINEKIENILKLYEAKIIDIAQLHGDEDEKYIETLKNRADLKVIKSIKAGTQQVLPENADWILFDTPSESLRGGTGKTFDWSLIPKINKPVFLAGGLNYANIEKAINVVHPFAVDINSGVETNGHKDFQKISDIIKLIRGLKNEQ